MFYTSKMLVMGIFCHLVRLKVKSTEHHFHTLIISVSIIHWLSPVMMHVYSSHTVSVVVGSYSC